MNNCWQLPDGVDELLPPQAEQAELLRQRLLNLFRLWGYELVSPPLFEFLDALVAGSGDDLALSTFKMTDQMSGRTLGFRADISSQVSRMDAISMATDKVQRLCYAGSTLLARPPASGERRCPVKVGAELYGYQGIASDIEMLLLMNEALVLVELPRFHLELGHVQIFRRLIAPLQLEKAQVAQLFAATQAKSASDLKVLLAKWNIPADAASMLMALPNLMGGQEILAEARRLFAKAPAGVQTALDELEAVAMEMKALLPALPLTFDLAELRGYFYHTGIMYTAYADDYGRPVAQGGRYDGLGSSFGRARPATGFDVDVKILMRLSNLVPDGFRDTVFVPWLSDDADAKGKLVNRLRQLHLEGYRVIMDLPGTATSHTQAGSSQLEWSQGEWVIQRTAPKGE